MKLASYLFRHTLVRWRENPWSVGARLLVGTLMSVLLVAGHCLFSVSQKMLEDRLIKSGVTSVAVQRFTFGGGRPELSEILHDLNSMGEITSLIKCASTATTDLGLTLTVYGYDDRMLPKLTTSGPTVASEQIFILQDGLPAGLKTEAVLEERTLRAAVIGTAPQLARIPHEGTDGILLVPTEFIRDLVREKGGMDTWIFTARSGPAVIPALVATIERLNKVDRLGTFTISAAGILRQLDELEKKRAIVVPAFIFLTAGVIASVFAALSLMEQRENRFVFALLRSMGAPPSALFAQFAAEGAMVALVGGSLALTLFRGLAAPVSHFSGQPELAPWILQSLAPAGGLPSLLISTLLIAVLLSCLPTWRGLREPIGKVLS